MDPLSKLPIIGHHAHSQTMHDKHRNTLMRIFKAEGFVVPRHFSDIAKDYAKLKKLDHPGLSGYMDICGDQNVVVIRRNYVQGFSLGSRIVRRPPIQPWEGILLSIGIGEVLQYLHSQDVVCCSVRADDVILTHDGRVVLVDYGLRAVHFDRIDLGRTPMHYVHAGPEGMEHSLYLDPTKELDVFNFGLLMYLVFNGKTPWPTSHLPNLMRDVTTGLIHSDPLLPWGVNNLITKMMAPKPEERPTIDDVMHELNILRDCLQRRDGPQDTAPVRKFSSLRDFGQVLLGLRPEMPETPVIPEKAIPMARTAPRPAESFAAPVATARPVVRLQPWRASRKASLTPGKPLRPLSGTMEASFLAMDPKDGK